MSPPDLPQITDESNVTPPVLTDAEHAVAPVIRDIAVQPEKETETPLGAAQVIGALELQTVWKLKSMWYPTR